MDEVSYRNDTKPDGNENEEREDPSEERNEDRELSDSDKERSSNEDSENPEEEERMDDILSRGGICSKIRGTNHARCTEETEDKNSTELLDELNNGSELSPYIVQFNELKPGLKQVQNDIYWAAIDHSSKSDDSYIM